jgi:thioredoxin-like negative regulator of GroEL
VKLLAIDWATAKAGTDAAALELWKQIAPTGEDWEQKLEEIPGDLPIARELAVALLREGNFACVPPAPPPCTKLLPDLGDPAPTTTLADPCLRRMLALWSVAQLEPDDLPRVHDALRAIAALPPPESELVAHAIDAYPDADQDERLDLEAIAWKAGQHDLVDGKLSSFDEAHMTSAAIDHHIAGILEILPAERYRSVFLHAITDDQMPAAARAGAMIELAATSDKLAPDVHTALAIAAKSKDCTVAAAAARTLDLHGDHRVAPRVPATHSPDAMMRSLCVLASFELQQRPEEASYLPGYLPSSGMQLVRETYDPYADPHTSKSVETVKPHDAVLPDLEDLVRAMRHCTGTTCTSDDREFKFTFKPIGGQLLISRLDVSDRPPCSIK